MLNLTACSVFSRLSVPSTGEQAANANVQLGLAYLQGGDVERAKKKLLLAESQAPTSAESQGAMGYFLESTGNFSQAEAYYRKAIDLNPKSGAAQNNYGTFLCRRERYAESDQHFLLALQDPNYVNTAQVYENAGLCAKQALDRNKAEAYFTEAVVQDPKRQMSWLALGRISYEKKDYPHAQQYLDQYMQLTKNPTAEAIGLGVVLARALGNESEAGRYTLMLQTRFPNSNAYKMLVKTSQRNNKQQKKQLYY